VSSQGAGPVLICHPSAGGRPVSGKPSEHIAGRDTSGNVYYYFVDAIGSTRVVTDASGNTCFDADYYPYGQENDYNTSCSPTYKFTGYEYDSETGNYYAYARYYDPRRGRFMSPDPLGGVVGNPQSMNRYAYVVNNPTTLVDPLGMGGCKNHYGDPVPCEDPPPPPPSPPIDRWGLLRLMWSGGINGCGILWCTPTPPPDHFLYAWAQGLLEAARAAAQAASGRARAPQAPTPQQKYQQCVQAANARADAAAVATFNQGFSGIGKETLGGAVGGAVYGCLFTSEVGCFEGAVPGALGGAIGGYAYGLAKAAYTDISGLVKVNKQFNQDLAACGGGG
jgi:RHS repeat-associated protein